MEKLEKENKLEKLLEIEDIKELYAFLQKNGYSKSESEFRAEIETFMKENSVNLESSELDLVAGGTNKNSLTKITSAGMASLIMLGTSPLSSQVHAGNFISTPVKQLQNSPATPVSTSKKISPTAKKIILTALGIGVGGTAIGISGAGIYWIYKHHKKNKTENHPSPSPAQPIPKTSFLPSSQPSPIPQPQVIVHPENNLSSDPDQLIETENQVTRPIPEPTPTPEPELAPLEIQSDNNFDFFPDLESSPVIINESLSRSSTPSLQENTLKFTETAQSISPQLPYIKEESDSTSTDTVATDSFEKIQNQITERDLLIKKRKRVAELCGGYNGDLDSILDYEYLEKIVDCAIDNHLIDNDKYTKAKYYRGYFDLSTATLYLLENILRSNGLKMKIPIDDDTDENVPLMIFLSSVLLSQKFQKNPGMINFINELKDSSLFDLNDFFDEIVEKIQKEPSKDNIAWVKEKFEEANFSNYFNKMIKSLGISEN